MKKVLCDKLRISEKETHLYKNSSISLDCDVMANSQQPIGPYQINYGPWSKCHMLAKCHIISKTVILTYLYSKDESFFVEKGSCTDLHDY
jgi:hypothetical protein